MMTLASRLSPKTAASAAWCAGAIVGAWLLVIPPDVVGDRLGLRRFQTPEIGPGTTFSQTFRMNAPNLNAVDVRVKAAGPVAGRVRLELVDVNADGGPTVIRSAEVEASEFLRGDAYRFEFAPIEDSRGRAYRLDILSVPDAPSNGVALWATKGERYRDGTLLANERERWADLAFQTHTPARSMLRALLDSRHLPRNAGLVALAGLFVSWLALGVVLREAARPDETV